MQLVLHTHRGTQKHTDTHSCAFYWLIYLPIYTSSPLLSLSSFLPSAASLIFPLFLLRVVVAAFSEFCNIFVVCKNNKRHMVPSLSIGMCVCDMSVYMCDMSVCCVCVCSCRRVWALQGLLWGRTGVFCCFSSIFIIFLKLKVCGASVRECVC